MEEAVTEVQALAVAAEVLQEEEILVVMEVPVS
jgi:hypothetical protein